MQSAILIKDFNNGKAVYGVKPPMKDYDDQDVEIVLISAAHGETYIFPADIDGKVTDWGELPGSQKGTLSHQKVLNDAGYDIIFK
jgi:hypothetical protein